MKNTLLTVLMFTAINSVYAAEATPLQQIIAGEQRIEAHKARDIYRHPQQTLDFFDVKSDMTVVEIWPGKSGWYTEILAPYLKDNGKLYAAHFAADASVEYFKKSLVGFNAKVKQQPDVYGKMELTVLQPPKDLNIAPDNSADRVLTFRNVHNWMKNEQAAAVFTAMYKALKKGGLLGVVEHRAVKDSVQDPKAISGYVTEAHVIKLAEQAGFELLEKSEINANSKDNTEHSKGVWTLPPSLRLKEQDKEKYLAIGESDRMTLKFIKR
ncbi:MAG: methyltransferase [Methylococcaceae bacterium]|nr:methyltransferase [Methylococcaceae bacterium]